MKQKVVLFVAMVMMSILPIFAQSKKIYLENLSQEEIDKCLDSQRYNVFELLDMGETVRYKRRNPYVLETNDGLRYSIDKNQAVVVDCSPDWKGGTIPSSVEYGGKTYPVQSIGASAFRLKRSVEEIVISEGVTRIEEYAFANMPSLRKVVFPNSLDSIEGGAFYGEQEVVCDFDLDYLHSVNDIYDNPHVILYYIPESPNLITVMELPEEMKYISGGVFNGSKNLEYVKLPLKLDFLDGYDGSPFDHCTSLKKVDLPSHISFFHPGAWRFVNDFSPFMDLSELSIGEWMPHCNNSISFNKNTQVLIMPFTMERCVGMSDFNGYYQLTTIVIPPSVKEIGKYNDPDELSWPWTTFYKAIWEYEPYKGYRPAFYGQQHLSDVVNLSEEPQNLLLPDNYSFERRELKYTGGHVTSFGERSGEYVFRTLHVPHGCKQAYLDAGWDEGDRFDAIEEDAEEIYARIKGEGASFIPTGVLATSPACALSVSRQGSVIRITNVNDNTPVDVYSVDGSFLYHTVASNGHALIDVGKQHGILLVKVGGETVKVVY